MSHCLVDDTLTTALIGYPIAQGWADADGVELVPNLTAEMAAERGACALIGSVDAALLAEQYVIVTDVSLVSHHAGSIALWSKVRPDEIEQAVVDLSGASRTAEAVARVTLPHFYAITVTAWDRVRGEGDLAVREGFAALQTVEEGFLNDLARAWFVLTGYSLPTHLLVAPKDLAREDPAAVRAVVARLRAARETGIDRRRELRRNLTDEHGLDRDRLTAFQNDQTFGFTKSARKAWLDLVRRVGHAMQLPTLKSPAYVTLGDE